MVIMVPPGRGEGAARIVQLSNDEQALLLGMARLNTVEFFSEFCRLILIGNEDVGEARTIFEEVTDELFKDVRRALPAGHILFTAANTYCSSRYFRANVLTPQEERINTTDAAWRNKKMESWTFIKPDNRLIPTREVSKQRAYQIATGTYSSYSGSSTKITITGTTSTNMISGTMTMSIGGEDIDWNKWK